MTPTRPRCRRLVKNMNRENNVMYDKPRMMQSGKKRAPETHSLRQCHRTWNGGFNVARPIYVARLHFMRRPASLVFKRFTSSIWRRSPASNESESVTSAPFAGPDCGTCCIGIVVETSFPDKNLLRHHLDGRNMDCRRLNYCDAVANTTMHHNRVIGYCAGGFVHAIGCLSRTLEVAHCYVYT